ncbi:MAG TPA: dienelactone hydrolase family protein [Kofleriaceae bacterium]|nr:dienelactone hydrolase family protein [Kofleriaceae bacterium]
MPPDGPRGPQGPDRPDGPADRTGRGDRGPQDGYPRFALAGLDAVAISPHPGARPRRLALALHGYGGDCTELLPAALAWRPLLADTELVLAEAPAPCAINKQKREWFPLTSRRDILRVHIVEAARKVRALLDELIATRELSRHDVALVGFSQGAMLALHVGLAAGVRAIAAFSGLLTSAAELGTGAPPPVFVAHGGRDRMVKPDDALAIATRLTAAGGDVTLHLEGELAHAVSDAGRRAAGRFLRDHLAPG